MKPHRFAYTAPASVLEAVDLLGSLGDDAKVLAGGQSLMPMLNLRLAQPAWLIDVSGVESLQYVEQAAGFLRVGAATPYSAVEAEPLAASGCPLLTKALPHIGHRAIRNRGTVGGSIAHADPAAELPAVLLALGGSVIATSNAGVREIPAAELFVMPLSSTLRPDELLEEVRLPYPPGACGSALVEVSRRHGDFAMVGVAAVATVDESGHFTDVALAGFGLGPTPIRLQAAETTAVGGVAVDAELLEAAGIAAAGEVSPGDDLHATGVYRRAVLPDLVARALREAAMEASERQREGA